MNPKSSSSIKKGNIIAVYNLARCSGELIRPEISKITGMTPPTVLKAVQYLLDKKILLEAGEVETSLGRRPVQLTFNPGAAVAVGIMFEGDEMHVGIVNLEGTILKSMKVPMRQSLDHSAQSMICQCIKDIMVGVEAPVLGVGIGIPGVVDKNEKAIKFAPLIGIKNSMKYTDLSKQILAETGLKADFENDVNAAAVGEFFARKLDNSEDLLYVSIGAGIGAGMVLQGKLRRGNRNLAGEFGYTVQNGSYKVERTRLGWLESNIGAESLKRLFDWRVYVPGEPVPEGIIEFITECLAPPVANLATQVDINRIVFGGRAVDFFGEELLKPLAEKINYLSLEDEIVEASCCADPGIVGAAMQIINTQLVDWIVDKSQDAAEE